MKNYVNRKEDRAVITFVIPAYNAELTLERTLNSVQCIVIFFSGKQRTWRRQKYRAETGGDGVRLLS